MGNLEAGDRVYHGGHYATVLESFEVVHVQWDAPTLITGTWPATAFTKVERAFELGQFVRVIETGEVGIVLEDDGDPEDEAPYSVGLFVDDEENEEVFSADELIPWIPHVGERVLESADVDSDEVGTVLACDGLVARVLWDDYALAQEFDVADLEPADEYDDFEVGDTVLYSNPVFAGPIEATIIGFDDAGLRVRFTRDFLPEGNYSKDVFTKKAA